MLTDIVVFSSEHCPNCEKLKENLTQKGVTFDVRDIQAKTSLVDMRCSGVFPQEAPVLRVNGRYLESKDIFEGDGLSLLALELMGL
jgi:glutaredoxin